jgi:hypothetical protein
MRPPRFIRYLLCRSRLIRMTVAFDILEKERVLNTYFEAQAAIFPAIRDRSTGPFIRFSIDDADHKSSPELLHFDTVSKNLCGRLGYTLSIGWSSGGGSANGPYRFYSVHASGLTYKVKDSIALAWDNHTYNKHLEEYYSALVASKRSGI